MNDETLKLVEQLAQKLGTTSEYLWKVLVKQAAISAAIDLLYFVLVIIGGIVLYKVHLYFGTEPVNGYSIYSDKEELTVIPMVIFASIWVIMALACFFSIGDIINGFFHPEYWALDKILSSCKS